MSDAAQAISSGARRERHADQLRSEAKRDERGREGEKNVHRAAIYVSYVPFSSLRPLRKRRSSLPRPFVALGLVVATAVTAAVALAARPKDHAAQAWNVLPPGQAGGVAFTKNSTDQIPLYDGLTLRRDRVTDADLRRYFKRETLGLGAEKAVRTERPRDGVTITRDRWGVPHVKGRTAEDVAFGAGWATAPTGS